MLTTGSVLTQNSVPIIVLTALHAGVIAAVFWMLLGNAIVATQVVEDGTPAAIVVSLSPSIFSLCSPLLPSPLFFP